VERERRRNTARRISRSCLWPLICLRRRIQGAQSGTSSPKGPHRHKYFFVVFPPKAARTTKN